MKQETHSSDTTAEAKRLMRFEVQARLRLLNASDRACFSVKMVQYLELFSHFQKAQRVAIYLPFASEPDLLPLVSRIGTKKFYAPRIIGESLEFARIPADFSKLLVGQLGNFEPDGAAEPLDRELLDLVLVPGLAFDKQGNRLGRGRGYYDRWLKTIPTCIPKIGVCFACQMSKQVPCSDDDVRMDMVLNENGLVLVTENNAK